MGPGGQRSSGPGCANPHGSPWVVMSPWGWHSHSCSLFPPQPRDAAGSCPELAPNGAEQARACRLKGLLEPGWHHGPGTLHRPQTGRTGISWPCWSLSCQHSQAGSSSSEHPQKYLRGEGGFAAASWTLSFSPWFPGPLCCSGCRLSGAPRSRSKSLRAAQPWGYAQMPVIYSSFQDTITKGAQQMPWRP